MSVVAGGTTGLVERLAAVRALQLRLARSVALRAEIGRRADQVSPHLLPFPGIDRMFRMATRATQSGVIDFGSNRELDRLVAPKTSGVIRIRA